MAKVSIIVPVYNERAYILPVLTQLAAVPLPAKEIIVVDDGSTDGTSDLLQHLHQPDCQVIFLPVNRGKGAAIRAGLKRASGEIIAIQDADLEYQPADLPRLIQPIVDHKTLVAYGSRIQAANPIGHWRYYWGNRLIAWLTNILYGSQLTDVETGYKVFHRSVLDQLTLTIDDFGFEAELTAKILKKGFRILEQPIHYSPRRFNQGKKIRWTDGLRAIWLLIKYRLR